MTEPMDEYLTRVRAQVSEHGVIVQAVSANPSTSTPAFAYTVGLAEIEEPELIIFGFQPYIAQDILNDLALPIVRGQAERSLTPGLTRDIFAGDVPAWLIEVKDSKEHLIIANQMFSIPGQQPVRALQVVFPDTNGLWPWQSGSLESSIPILGDQP